MVDFKAVTKTHLIICLNVVALLLFAALVLEESVTPQTVKVKVVENSPQEKIKLSLPKTSVKISTTEMPPVPQKIAQVQANRISNPKMSVMKRAEIQQEKVDLPPPLKFVKRADTQQEKVDLPPPLKAVRNKNDRLERVKPLVALKPFRGGLPSVSSGLKLNPVSTMQVAKKVESEQRELDAVSKPALVSQKLEEKLTISAADISQGMAILRETEQGKPLNFEIFWPQERNQSEKLYNLLSSCYGMQSALLDDQGNLYFPAKKKGRLPSGFSPLLHQVKQAAAFGEAQKLNALRKRHSLKHNAVSLRVHRRTTHAALLSGLKRLSNKPLSEFNSISARYEISGRELVITDVKFNDVMTLGRIALGRSTCG